MTILEVAAIAEIVGAIAVVITLIYLAVQIRDSNVETRATTTQAALDSELFLSAELVRYAAIWDKVVSSLPLADGEETRRGIILYNMLMTQFENRYRQYTSGYLEDLPTSVDKLVALPFFDAWRGSLGASTRNPDFLELVDRLRAESTVK